MSEVDPGLEAGSLVPRPVLFRSDAKEDSRDRAGQRREQEPAQRRAGWVAEGSRLHPPSPRSAVPASPPLCRSLSVPAPLVHCLFSSDLPGAVSMLTFRLPTCHHLSRAIRVMAQGFPLGSGLNGEPRGTCYPREGAAGQARRLEGDKGPLPLCPHQTGGETEAQEGGRACQGAECQQLLPPQSPSLLRTLPDQSPGEPSLFPDLMPASC